MDIFLHMLLMRIIEMVVVVVEWATCLDLLLILIMEPFLWTWWCSRISTNNITNISNATNILGNTATVLSQGFPGGGADTVATTDPNGSGGGGGGAGERGYAGASHSGVTPSNNWGRGGNGYQVPAPFLDPFKPVIPNPFLNIGHSDPGFRYFGGGGGGSDFNNNGGSGRGFGVPGGLGGGGRGATDPGPGTKHGEAGLNHRGGGGGGGSTHSGDGKQVDLDVVLSSISSNRIVMIKCFWKAIKREG